MTATPQIVMIPQEPPATTRAQYVDWGGILRNLRDNHPGEWMLVATDIHAHAADYLRRNNNVEARGVGYNSKTKRHAELYVRWHDGSFLGERAEAAERIQLRRSEEMIAKVKAKRAKAEAQTKAQATEPEAE